MTILRCKCKHPFQDRTYGKGLRVHNKMNSKENMYRCTVCGTERSGRRER